MKSIIALVTIMTCVLTVNAQKVFHFEKNHDKDSVQYTQLKVWNDTIPVLVEVYISANKDSTQYTIAKRSAFEVFRRELKVGCSCVARYSHSHYLQLDKKTPMINIVPRKDK